MKIRITESELIGVIKKIISEDSFDKVKERRLFRYMDKIYPIDSLEKVIHPSYPNITFYMRNGVVVFAHKNERTSDGVIWVWLPHASWKNIEGILSLTRQEVKNYLMNWLDNNLGIGKNVPTTFDLIRDHREFINVIKNIESGNLEPISHKKIKIPKKYSNLIYDMGHNVNVYAIINLYNDINDVDQPSLVSYLSSKKVFINSDNQPVNSDSVFEVLDEFLV